MEASGVCTGSEENFTACHLMNYSGTPTTAAGVQCSKYWMCALCMGYIIDYYYYIWKVIIRGLPSESRAFVYYYFVFS